MEFWRYLWPENPIAIVVVCFIWVVFAIWLAILVVRIWRAFQHKGLIKKCEKVDSLARILQENFKQKEFISGESNSLTLLSLETEREFNGFWRNISGGRKAFVKSPIARHLKAIFEAGKIGSNLEVAELIKHTSNDLFKLNGLLRSLLAIFIILGLLGTLFGLTDSLGKLPPMEQVVSSENYRQVIIGLNSLISALKGAFAPSIWGVLFTVLGVIFFALYVQFLCLPLKDSLEHLTLTVWIPKLIPTVSQRMIDAMVTTEKQILENRKTMNRVASLADNIESKSSTLNQSLTNADDSLNRLVSSSTQLSEFANKFVEGVGSLMGFGIKLEGFYIQMSKLQGQMVQESREFHTNVQNSIDKTEAFQKLTYAALENQHTQVENLLKVLSRYESAYIESRQKIDEGIKKMLDSAQKAYDELSYRNQELVDNIGNPLREDLTTKLGEIKEELQSRLSEIKGKIGELSPPVEKAVNKICGALENFDRGARDLTQKWNHGMAEQDRKNREHLNHLKDLNSNINTLLQELPKTVDLQGEKAQALAQSLSKMSEDFASFGTSISEFGRNFKVTGEHLQHLENVKNQNAQIIETLNQFSIFLKEQSKKIESLISDKEQVDKQVANTLKEISSSITAQSDNLKMLNIDVNGMRAEFEALTHTANPSSHAETAMQVNKKSDGQRKAVSSPALVEQRESRASYGPKKVEKEKAGERASEPIEKLSAENESADVPMPQSTYESSAKNDDAKMRVSELTEEALANDKINEIKMPEQMEPPSFENASTSIYGVGSIEEPSAGDESVSTPQTLIATDIEETEMQGWPEKVKTWSGRVLSKLNVFKR